MKYIHLYDMSEHFIKSMKMRLRRRSYQDMVVNVPNSTEQKVVKAITVWYRR